MLAQAMPGESPISRDRLRELQQRSDSKGLRRFAAHIAFIGAAGALYFEALARGSGWGTAFAIVPYGFSLASMFAAMHEAVHRTAFRSTRLNDAVAWVAGLLSFYNGTFYRPYHGWHHRFTQIPGKDPELDDGKPSSLGGYLLELSGLPWWVGKIKTHLRLALGRTRAYPFLNTDTGRAVVRSVRWQLAVYAAVLVWGAWAGRPWLFIGWLAPLAAGQPLLRAILLAEHTGCSADDDPYRNTRTTKTVGLVRFLMWEMPYHAEHHTYAALPFHALARAHQDLAPYLVHKDEGYLRFNAKLAHGLWSRSRGASPTDTPPPHTTHPV